MPSQTSNRVLKHPRGQNRSNALEKSGDNEAQMDELGNDPGQVGSDSAGQSGDTQGLSQTADAAGESVEELADTDQAYEAEAISGIGRRTRRGQLFRAGGRPCIALRCVRNQCSRAEHPCSAASPAAYLQHPRPVGHEPTTPLRGAATREQRFLLESRP
jgi:hypothetical protein